MANPAAVTSLGLVFHAIDFFIEAVALAGARDFGTLNDWLPQNEGFPIVDSQYPVEIYGAALGNFERLNLQAFARDDLILFTTGFNYCVNSNTSA